MSSRVLIAWEFGSGLGHLACMWPIIKGLRARGIEPLVAVPDPERARAIFGPDAPRLIAAVPLDRGHVPRTPIYSFADILLQRGLGDTTALRAAVDGWQALYRAERIDTVLLDYAPAAQLAAWLMNLRMVTWTFVFANPPLPFPPIVSDVTPAVRHAMLRSESRLLAAVNEVSRQLGRTRMASLADWMHAPKRFMVGLPETNIFDFEPEGGYLGPLGELPNLPEPEPWIENGKQRVLCYLRWSAEIPELTESLKKPGRDLRLIVPGAPMEWVRQNQENCFMAYSEPIGIRQLLSQSDFLLANGSVNVSSEAVDAGAHQFLFPIDIEKALVSRKLENLRLATLCTPSPGIDKQLEGHVVNAIGTSSKSSRQPIQKKRTSCPRLLELIASASEAD